MKVIHIPYCFYPDDVGGTEVYVEALAREQARLGIHSVIAAPAPSEAAYDWRGLPVRRFFEGPFHSTADLYGEGSQEAAQSFGRIVDAELPDVVHLHAFSRSVSLRLVQDCRRRGLPVVFSYHTPTFSCLRGTLMRWGQVVCDGRLDASRCAQCKLHDLGLDRLSSAALAGMPLPLTRWLGEHAGGGRVSTALLMPGFVARFHEVLRQFLQEIDHVIAFRQWARQVLLDIGLPESKLTVSPQGLLLAPALAPAEPAPDAASPLRLAFFGRIAPVKGVHILIQALRRVAAPSLQLDLYGTQPHDRYAGEVEAAARADRRIAFRAPVAAQDVVGLLRSYSALVVPSQWLETGPLVVLEAFAAGIPVIGSRLGGIAELVEHGVNGLLVEPAEVADWVRTLSAAAADPSVLNRLRQGIRPPREMRECAADLLPVYTALLQEVH